MPNRTEQLTAVAKQYGVVRLAKLIVDEQNAQGLSEHELCKMFSAAIERRSGETREQAFSRCFSANDEEGLLMRKAVGIAKGYPQTMSTTPTQVGGRDATNVNDGQKAYRALMQLAQEQHRRSPELSIAQAFAQVYQAQENAALAARERINNRPRA